MNPTGGGLRTPYGDVFAQTLMPQNHVDTGNDVWTGDITKFLRIGGDLRFDGTITQTPTPRPSIRSRSSRRVFTWKPTSFPIG